MSKLIELPNGDWVHPDYILMIEVLDNRDDSNLHDPHDTFGLRVHLGSGEDTLLKWIQCKTLEIAKELRDKLIKKCKGKKEKEPGVLDLTDPEDRKKLFGG